MTNTNATYATSIAVDLPDYPAATVTFTNTAFFVSGNSEVLPGKQYSLTLNSTGQGTQTLPCPDNTGDAAVNWRINLPSKESGTYAIAYDAATQQLSDILAAQSTTADPDAIAAALAGKMDKDTDGTIGNLTVLDVNGNAVDAGYGSGAFDAAGSAAAAQAAAIADAATKYYNQSTFSAAPTAAEPLKANGSGGIVFGAKVAVGAAGTDDTLFNARRSITGAINSHAYRDESTHTPGAGSMGYAAFDAEYSMSGGQNYDHYAGFQNRPIFNGSGTITKHRGFWSLPTHTGSGTLTSLQHFYAANVAPSGGGVITTQYGLYVEPLTGGTSNYAVYTSGSTPSFFGGLLWTNSNLRVDGLASFGGVAANSAYQVYTATTLDATKIAANAVLATAPINLSSGTTYGAFYSIAALNNTLAAIGTNFIYGFAARAAIQAAGANSAARYAYAAHVQASASANAGYTATALGMYGLLVDSFVASGAGTLSFGATAGIVINNQGTAKAPTSYGLKIEDQSGSTASYALYTGAGSHRIGNAAATIGFYAATPVAQQTLATGAGATVDNVITILQNLGLVKQS